MDQGQGALILQPAMSCNFLLLTTCTTVHRQHTLANLCFYLYQLLLKEDSLDQSAINTRQAIYLADKITQGRVDVNYVLFFYILNAKTSSFRNNENEDIWFGHLLLLYICTSEQVGTRPILPGNKIKATWQSKDPWGFDPWSSKDLTKLHFYPFVLCFGTEASI